MKEKPFEEFGKSFHQNITKAVVVMDNVPFHKHYMIKAKFEK